MTHSPLDPTFRTALRDQLMLEVTNTPPRKLTGGRSRRHRTWLTTGFVLTVIGAGGGIAVAADLLPAPGADRVTLTAPAITGVRTGTATVPLGDRPLGSTNIELTLTCLTPGTFAFADGAKLICTPRDTGGDQSEGTATYTLVLHDEQSSTTITTTADTRWSLTTAYSKHQETPFAVNAHGDTYGVANDNGTPDLIAAIATNGKQGYVHSDDLEGPTPRSPAEAMTWNKTHAGQHRTLPVYTSDGRTVIGEFRMG